jgi:hypothetical protein
MTGEGNKNEIRVCKKCGYKRGFHVYFNDVTDGKVRIGLICPSCGQSYDIGWITSDVNDFEPKEGKSYEDNHS